MSKSPPFDLGEGGTLTNSDTRGDTETEDGSGGTAGTSSSPALRIDDRELVEPDLRWMLTLTAPGDPELLTEGVLFLSAGLELPKSDEEPLREGVKSWRELAGLSGS